MKIHFSPFLVLCFLTSLFPNNTFAGTDGWGNVTGSIHDRTFFSAPVPDTGQTACYDNATEIPCPQEGESFYGQDGNFRNHPHSYTKLGKNGVVLSNTASQQTGWEMTRDNVTGLVWEVKNNDGGIHDKDNTYTWCDPKSSPETCGNGTTVGFISMLNDQAYGGFRDWRMPSAKELAMLVDSSVAWPGPTIDSTFFPSTTPLDYWTATPVFSEKGKNWQVNFNNGFLTFDSTFNKNFYVRAVRGPKIEKNGLFFLDNSDGTITDLKTGLMWQKEPLGPYKWDEALSITATLQLAGYSNWRLPDRNELLSLVDFSTANPAIATTFPPPYPESFWTSTSRTFDAKRAWRISFTDGYVSDREKQPVTPSYYIRVVRGGNQNGPVVVNPVGGSESGGTTVTLYGSGFGNTQEAGSLLFDGQPASITSWTDNAVTCLAPPHPPGLVAVQLTKNDSSVAALSAFIYVQKGDLNCDQAIDLGDIVGGLAALSNHSDNPICPAGDTNANNLLDFEDIFHTLQLIAQ